jgi:hypothetical protein
MINALRRNGQVVVEYFVMFVVLALLALAALLALKSPGNAVRQELEGFVDAAATKISQ